MNKKNIYIAGLLRRSAEDTYDAILLRILNGADAIIMSGETLKMIYRLARDLVGTLPLPSVIQEETDPVLIAEEKIVFANAKIFAKIQKIEEKIAKMIPPLPNEKNPIDPTLLENLKLEVEFHLLHVEDEEDNLKAAISSLESGSPLAGVLLGDLKRAFSKTSKDMLNSLPQESTEEDKMLANAYRAHFMAKSDPVVIEEELAGSRMISKLRSELTAITH